MQRWNEFKWVLIVATGVLIALLIWTGLNAGVAAWQQAKEAEREQKEKRELAQRLEDIDREHQQRVEQRQREDEEEKLAVALAKEKQEREQEEERRAAAEVQNMWTQMIRNARPMDGRPLLARLRDTPEHKERARLLSKEQMLREEIEALTRERDSGLDVAGDWRVELKTAELLAKEEWKALLVKQDEAAGRVTK